MTQTIVGTRSTSAAIEVIAASSSDTMIAALRSGSEGICRQYVSVLAAPIPVPRVLNSNIAAIGTRKNSPAAMNTPVRKTSRRRRLRALTPERPGERAGCGVVAVTT